MAARNTQETQSQKSQQDTARQTGAVQTGATQSNVHQDRERPMQTSREGRGTALSHQQGFGQMQPLVSGTPFSFMRRLSDDMDRLFSDFGLTGGLAPFSSTLGRDIWSETSGSSLWAPQVDLFRRGENLVIRADLPGLTKEDISVDADDNALTIRGERKQESEEDREGYYYERTYGAFQRTIPLPEGVNADDAKAEFHDGVLEIVVPAPRQVQRNGKKIQIH